MQTIVDPATEFVAALAAQDWQRLSDCLAPELRFHAIVPRDDAFRERASATEATELVRLWFGDADPLDLLASSVEPLVDRVRITYRFGAHKDGRWNVIEQRGFATVEDGRIARLDLVCSGFQPVPERPAT